MTIELEKYINYGEYFGKYIDDRKYNPTKKQQVLRCPLPNHDDSEASFSLNLDTGKWNCFGCGESGNVVNFHALMHNMDTTEAFRDLCELYRIPQEEKKDTTAGLTVESYAAAKHLDAAWLKSTYLLNDVTYFKAPAVCMPYLDENVHLFRKRVRMKNKKIRWGEKGTAFKDGQTPLYGVHLIGAMGDEVVLVEGESDTQSLMFCGIDAVGAAGASMLNEHAAASLSGKSIVVHDDGDRGGEVFCSKVTACLGEVKHFRCRDIDPTCKDPSDVLIKYGREKARELICGAIEHAEVLTATKEITAPQGYFVNDDGVFNDDGRITRTPLYIKSVVRDVETRLEKVEVGWQLRGNEESRVFERATALNSRKVVDAFAPLGINASSANAKAIVEYLTACDAAGVSEFNESTPHLGWVDKDRFAPLVSGNVLLDLDDGLSQRAAFVKCAGDIEGWRAVVGEARNNITFRFMLAASFASPLIRIVGGRPMFVHVWASSRGGKTAALKAALSVWGEPDRLMTTFRSTLNAMCSLAELMCDLPVGIDERQMMQGSKQQERVEEAVYTLAGGHRKDRSTVTGGLQQSGVWNSIFITTGEVPLLGSSTMTGAATRTIELNEKPFIVESDAKAMHDGVKRQHGVAGVVYIEEVMRRGWDDVRELHAKMLTRLSSMSPYADMVALVGVADYLAGVACFDEDKWELSAAMAEEVLAGLRSADEIDINREAVQRVADFIADNAGAFDNQYLAEDLGMRFGGITYIKRDKFEKLMIDRGLDITKTLKYMGENGLIEMDGKGHYTKKVQRNGLRARMVVVHDAAMNRFLDECPGALTPGGAQSGALV